MKKIIMTLMSLVMGFVPIPNSRPPLPVEPIIVIEQKEIPPLAEIVLEPVAEIVAEAYIEPLQPMLISDPTSNENITWNFLIAQGFSRTQVAGIMGNLMQEHGFKTSDTSGGLGIAQWMGGRKANLMSKDGWDTIQVQLLFLMEELNGGYLGVKNNIINASSVEDATVIFQNQFERCGVCMEGQRIQYAYNILARY